MNTPVSLPIGQLLLGQGKIDEADLARALAFQRNHGGRLGGILIRLGALSEESLLPALAEQTGYGLESLEDVPDAHYAAALHRLKVGTDWPRQMQTLVWEDALGTLHATAPDPLDPALQEAVGALADQPVAWHFTRLQEFERVLAALGAGRAEGGFDAAQLRELAEDAPIVNLVNSLIAQAIDERASDIHLEPGEHHCEIRYRIDGVLHTRSDLSVERYPAVTSRIKLIANLDIAERRLPQDGRITIRASGADMDMRVSVMPAVHGESIVMRLLPKKREDLGLERLGLEADHLAQLRSWLDLPSGIVLVTGPTGSGKSTTLYAALNAINDRRRKIVTVEDPVEHQLPGVIQIQVQAEIGYTFARALRSILRHDPDIIMIGEIRDRETAEIAIQSALTGHLVLATLHTNDALSAFTRLVDMGIEPFLVAASCQAVMAQRLVRRLCPHCSRPAAVAPGEPGDWREPVGCAHCQDTGYHGRTGIYELVGVGPGLRHAVAGAAPAAELARLADAAGRRDLRADGMLKAARGLTSMEEVARLAGTEEAVE
jgi:general secretion pathway protein E